MERTVYILVMENLVEAYYNLKHLTDNNPSIPYMKAYRGLSDSNSFITDKYSIHKSKMKYRTNRHTPNG